MKQESSYRQILRSSSVIGGASIAGIFAGMLRVKALAYLLGPGGVGLMGVLDSIMSTTATLAGLGLGNSGVRQLAASGDDVATFARVRRALWLASIFLGATGGFALWLLRLPVARFAFGDAVHATQVGWLSVGVFFAVIAAAQTALLQGLRRIADMARASILGASFGAIGGVIAIWIWGEAGVIAFVLLSPAMSSLAAGFYARRVPRPMTPKDNWRELLPQWQLLLSLGAVFMAVAVMASSGHLLVRVLITRQLGMEATGHFQAAWAISMQYLGFVLAAMTADYFPRLTASIHSREHANRLVNEQIEVGLALAGPAILAMLALAPWVVRTLYSTDFTETIDILRWQALGDILKVASWPMGFVLIARAERLLFFCTQSLWIVAYVLYVWLGLPRLGLEVTGIAFFACYLLGFLVNWAIVAKLAGFGLTRYNLGLLTLLLIAGTAILLCAHLARFPATELGVCLAFVAGLYSLRHLIKRSQFEGRLGQAIGRLGSRWR